MRLDTVFRAQAVRYPEKTAVVCGSDRITYGELDTRVRRVAEGLMRLGAQPGDRIVVYLGNGAELVELLYAAFSIGAIVVPVSTRLTLPELQHICRDSQPFAIALAGDPATCAALAKDLPRALFITTEAREGRSVDFTELRSTEAGILGALPTDDDALVMYTSGTTGAPKGAIITHSNMVVQNYFVHAVEWGISNEDRYLVTTPLAHRAGLARLVNALSLGGTLVIMKSFDAKVAVKTVETEGITVAGMVPTVCRMMLPAIQEDPSRCASLKCIVVTGEAFPVELKRKFMALLPDVRLVSFFAMTEAGAVTSLSHEEQFVHPDSIGRPTPGVEIRIVDDRGIAVAPGEPGELLVRAGEPGRFTVMRGYYNRPDETAKVLRDGWLCTGDIAKADAHGYLYIVDRKKDVVLSGGLNIYTKEVEQALLAHPGVRDAAVIGVPDEIFGESVVAFIERQDTMLLTAADLIASVQERIAGYKKPKHVFIVDSLPRNGTGKVLKQELRTRALQSLQQSSGTVPV
ncbi:class I adenylate-forming enzyme family protein [Bradyrhizobium canariense]|uniref:class I adenylate-forming enzyme family protein n=1 Tax=Bradyrhizobium canariense TaxID=255045 RepID=UPI001B8A7F1A|nr:AMP-binding protein [Bradyrhizobium canariense]MBR0954925.1 AMP-binding protein [Bradyrhizobium canariense]